MKHERRYVGHTSGWQEPMDTCVCGQKWPCTGEQPSSKKKVSQPPLKPHIRLHVSVGEWGRQAWSYALYTEHFTRIGLSGKRARVQLLSARDAVDWALRVTQQFPETASGDAPAGRQLSHSGSPYGS